MRSGGHLHGDASDTAAGTLDGGFEQWVELAASELAYFANLELPDAAQTLQESGSGPLPPEAAVSFLLGEEVLGDCDGQELPGYYKRAEDMRLAGQNMLYTLYGTAWRAAHEPPDGVDCDLRLYTDCDPEEDEGTVIALDATPRNSGAAGLVIFLLDSVALSSFVCRSEEDLRQLYSAVDAGRIPTHCR